MDVLAPLAERLIAALEQPSEAPIKPRPVLHDLEAELLAGRQPQVQTSTTAGRGGEQPSAGRVSVASSKAVEESSSELELLRADCEQLLHQREKMRAQLIAEQDRRERAEADLVALGAQWLGTETQQALAERADAERRRALTSSVNLYGAKRKNQRCTGRERSPAREAGRQGTDQDAAATTAACCAAGGA